MSLVFWSVIAFARNLVVFFMYGYVRDDSKFRKIVPLKSSQSSMLYFMLGLEFKVTKLGINLNATIRQLLQVGCKNNLATFGLQYSPQIARYHKIQWQEAFLWAYSHKSGSLLLGFTQCNMNITRILFFHCPNDDTC